jgi:hypothetical protein
MNGESTSDARLADIERALRAIDARLAAVEAITFRAAAPDESAEPARFRDAAAPGTHAPAVDGAAVMTLAGRTLVVLGGAYLLRALTEAAVITPRVGVALGFAYAAAWLAVAARQRERLSAAFHGATAVLIAIPLLWEAVTRFQIIRGAAASGALVIITCVVLGVAVWTRLRSLAWFVIGGAMPASVALTVATGAVLPFAVADMVLGVATLWIGYTIDWVWLRWPVAAIADLAVMALAIGVATHTAVDPPSRIVAVQLLLLTGYVASVAIRTLVRGREVLGFEVVQVIAALAVGFGGAVFVAGATGLGGGLLVAIGVATGVACYAVAFAFVARRQGLRHNFYFYTSLALILVIAGSALGLDHPAPLWAALAVIASWTATRADRFTLSVHAAVYYAAAAAASGLLAASATALAGPAVAQSPVSVPLLIVFAAGCICWTVSTVSTTPTGSIGHAADRYAIVPRVVIAVIVSSAAAAWLVALLVSDGTNPGVLATLRTASLAATALTLALLGGRMRLREAAWLVYPALVVGALKLVAEDLPRSNAATLFAALAMYGGVLIAAPRFMRPGVRSSAG